MENTTPNHFDKLTNREIEILYLLAEGLRNQQIADELSITIQTVKFHAGNIYSKLGFNCRSEAIAWVWRNRESIISGMTEKNTIPKYRAESQDTL